MHMQRRLSTDRIIMKEAMISKRDADAGLMAPRNCAPRQLSQYMWWIAAWTFGDATFQLELQMDEKSSRQERLSLAMRLFPLAQWASRDSHHSIFLVREWF